MFRLSSLLALPVIALLAIAPVSSQAAGVFVYLTDEPGNFADCDPGGAPGDGVINYDVSTATGACNFGALPGLALTFTAEYGAGPAAGGSGATGVLYHISFTSFTLSNGSDELIGPGDVGFGYYGAFAFPGGAKWTETTLTGTAFDVPAAAGNVPGVNIQFIGGGGIDYDGVSWVDADIQAAGAFATSNLAGDIIAPGGGLFANLFFTVPSGDGFFLPGSFDVEVIDPTVVPAPAAIWLLGSGLALLAGRHRRRLKTA